MRRTATLAAAIVILLLPALALSQEPVRSFDQLDTRLRVGDRIILTDAQGRDYEGKVLAISPSALTLRDSNGQQVKTASEVRLIQERQRDSLKNGALIGLACGLAVAGTAAADCAGGECELSPSAVFAIAGGLYGGIGAAIGTGIDALIPGKARVVYRAPEGSQAARVVLSPVVTSRIKGIALRVTF
jgi:hypothetical protein